MPAITSNIIDLMGGTPLVELSRLSDGLPGRVVVKLEAFNPGGSVKDRIGVSMIEAAEKAGQIEPGKTTIVEATSGNTGIALAFVAAAKGYDLILTLPEGMSRERQGLLKLYGAKVEIVESMGGMGEAVDAARKLGRGDDYFLPDQFSNPANPDVHRRTTAEEIWADTDGKVDVFVAGVGTGGTITGVGERLKERKAGVKVVAVEPAASPVLSGGKVGIHRIQGIGAGFVPPVLNRQVLDEIISVEDDDAIDSAREISMREGISCGISGGAALRAALDIAARPESKGKLIVTVIPDTGERYVSSPFFTP
jgi:cysteine synthase A